MINNKNILIICSIFITFAVFIAIFVKEKNNPEIADSFSKIEVTRKDQVTYPTPFFNMKKIRSDKDGSLSLDLERGYDLTPFGSVSDNEEMVKLFAYLANNPSLYKHELARIDDNNDAGYDKFYFKGEELFRAPHIYKYSVSPNDVIALEVITNRDNPTYKNPGVDFDAKASFFPVTYGEIWIVKPNQKAYKISPSSMNVRNPSISNNGRKVAFTANLLDQTNRILNEFLVVVDLETDGIEYFNSPNMAKDHYTISPVMWMKDDKVLRTAEDWGETGGHGKVGYIDFNN